MRPFYQAVGEGVFAVDTGHVRPHADASYLLIDEGRAAFVDTGTGRSVPNLLEALPRARVAVHPRGAAHLIDPAKLIKGTRAVYGEAAFAAQFGEVMPIPAERIVTLADGECQFDPGQLHASIARIVALEPRCAYLTHYGRVDAIEKLAADLHDEIDACVRIARAAPAQPDRARCIERELFRHLSDRLAAHGFAGDEQARHAVLDGDVALNAAGLDAWLSRAA